jgi:hypothetical protein
LRRNPKRKARTPNTYPPGLFYPCLPISLDLLLYPCYTLFTMRETANTETPRLLKQDAGREAKRQEAIKQQFNASRQQLRLRRFEANILTDANKLRNQKSNFNGQAAFAALFV